VPPKRAAKPPAIPVQALAPVLKPLIEPVVESVLSRLDRVEKLLEELKTAADVQFKRSAAMQAQIDHLVALLSKRGA
jgi:hypothetical protein